LFFPRPGNRGIIPVSPGFRPAHLAHAESCPGDFRAWSARYRTRVFRSAAPGGCDARAGHVPSRASQGNANSAQDSGAPRQSRWRRRCRARPADLVPVGHSPLRPLLESVLGQLDLPVLAAGGIDDARPFRFVPAGAYLRRPRGLITVWIGRWPWRGDAPASARGCVRVTGTDLAPRTGGRG
jgi:hypothetical protein